MGSEQSQLSDVDIEEKALEVNDFWSHHTATINSGNQPISVFIGDNLVSGALWIQHTPLEKAAKNLMIHRHPCILKYISSWNHNSKYYLAVEDCKPLTQVLKHLNYLQICVGLHSIVKSLVFLHEKALVSHNNLSIASIYVTNDGQWKLGGMEYLCKFTDLNLEYLSKTKTHRYRKALDPNEERHISDVKATKRYDFIDIYALSVLIKELFKHKSDVVLPTLNEFLHYSKNELRHLHIEKRPKLDALLQHTFFNHEFITIHSFLTELPLKNESEKKEFFISLIERLKQFDEHIVAKQLGSLLLSRMVLLNSTARWAVIPFLLNPNKQAAADNDSSKLLFTMETFRIYIVPKLLDIFCVREVKIRFVLLQYWHRYLPAFSKEQLQQHILPELLVGIKDTNERLVSVTLRSLADLVIVLGAATVIGGKRAKLFIDGSPTSKQPPAVKTKRKLKQQQSDDALITVSAHSVANVLPERPSPDGEEGETSSEEIVNDFVNELLVTSNDEIEVTDDDDEVQEVETSNESEITDNNVTTFGEDTWEDFDINPETASSEQRPLVGMMRLNGEITTTVEKQMPDILQLDIKNQKNSETRNKIDDYDFFQDMEPVIQASTKFCIADNNQETELTLLNLSVQNAENHEEGWGDDLNWED